MKITIIFETTVTEKLSSTFAILCNINKSRNFRNKKNYLLVPHYRYPFVFVFSTTFPLVSDSIAVEKSDHEVLRKNRVKKKQHEVSILFIDNF